MGVLEQNFLSLEKLADEWEDYEEPKECWYIDCDGKVYEPTRLQESDLDRMEEIGNYFESKEEAEKAVEKLKAWKRLKDRYGLDFNGMVKDSRGKFSGVRVKYDDEAVTMREARQAQHDVAILFGSEES